MSFVDSLKLSRDMVEFLRSANCSRERLSDGRDGRRVDLEVPLCCCGRVVPSEEWSLAEAMMLEN